MRGCLTVEADVFVDIIGHHHHVRMAVEHTSEGAIFGLGVAGAGWVRRGVEQQPACALGNRGIELCGGELEALAFRAGKRHRNAVGGDDHIRV